MRKLILLLFLFSCVFSNAQNFWEKLPEESKVNSKTYRKKNSFDNYELFSLNKKAFLSYLKTPIDNKKKNIKLPDSKGNFIDFTITETSYFEKELANKYPNLKSYTAQGIKDVTLSAKISVGTDGVHILIHSTKNSDFFIDPYTKDNNIYVGYQKSSLSKKNQFSCQTKDLSINEKIKVNPEKITANSGKLRIYRLALACSGEYAQFHLQQQNIPETATDFKKKEAILSAMNTSITRVNSIFQRDLAVQLNIVNNNDEIIFLDSQTDGITEGNPSKMLNESQRICDNIIGNDNYDIGHLFSIGVGGIAGLGVVCIKGAKANGVTGLSEPIADPFDIDYVSHEIGHQFGANHTQNNSCQQNSGTAVEPGSGSTIMSYAGICDPNIQSNSDAYFHSINIDEIKNILLNSATCAEIIETENNIPTANAGLNYTIPASTPFVLKGFASDADGNEKLTYSWEQIDNEKSFMPPKSTNIDGPLFRSLPPSINSYRYFPKLESVLDTTKLHIWEVLPSVARDMAFVFTVRDNNLTGGETKKDIMRITVIDSEPFKVFSPEENVLWQSSTQRKITWNVSNTNIAPINCQNVRIKLSTDGGNTFPFVLADSTTNDGSEMLTIPNITTDNARILIEAIDNVFFAINPKNFTIVEIGPTFQFENNLEPIAVCNTEKDEVVYNIDINYLNGFNEAVELSASNLPKNTTVSFDATTITESGSINVAVNGFTNLEAGLYNFTITGQSRSIIKTKSLQLYVYSPKLSKTELSQPFNKKKEINLTPTLQWKTQKNASYYQLEVSSAKDFITKVVDVDLESKHYTLVKSLAANTNYFWRVRTVNNCVVGEFSEVFYFKTVVPKYCSSTFINDAGGMEYISNVTFNTINHNSDNDTEDGYQDFTEITTTVKQDNTYTISVTVDTAGFQDHCFVFIDWNQNAIFENDETYDLGTIFQDIGIATFDITVPKNASEGNTKMRVLIEYDDLNNGFGKGACDIDHKTEWGETEDYTLKIAKEGTLSNVENTFENFSLYPNPSDGNFRLKFLPKRKELVTLKLLSLNGRTLKSKLFFNLTALFDKNIHFKNISSGLYLLQIENGTTTTTKKIIFQ